LAAGHVLHSEPQGKGEPELFTGVALGNDEARQISPFALGNGLLAVATVSASDGAGNALGAHRPATRAQTRSARVPGTEFFYPVAVTGSVVEAVGISNSGRDNPVLVSV